MKTHKIKITAKAKLFITFGLLLVTLLLVAGWAYQNYQALQGLHASQNLDAHANYAQAKKKLQGINVFSVLTHIQHEITDEKNRNAQLLANAQKLQMAKALLRSGKTQEALDLLKTITGGSQQTQATVLQHSVQQGTSNGGHSVGTTSGGASTNPGGGGGSGGNPSPAPPGPMTNVSTGTASATQTPSGSGCSIHVSVSFTSNGTGTVAVVWYITSSASSSFIANGQNYTFNAAGTQSDSVSYSMNHLQPGDHYTLMARVSDTGNSAITSTSAPAIISTCGSTPNPPSVPPGTMASIIPGTAILNYVIQDSVFPNECSVELTVPFSTDGSGTVGVSWHIRSSSSGGITNDPIYYNFGGAGSDTDHYYVRVPYANAGDHFTATAYFTNPANGAVSAISNSVTFNCP